MGSIETQPESIERNNSHTSIKEQVPAVHGQDIH